MTNHISRDCWNQNVRVNCIAPGPIATSFLDGVSNFCFQQDFILGKGLKYSLFPHRIGKPEEVASLVAFLLSDDASYISGQTVICSGGMTFARNI
ncbi:Dehydrogenase/reductase SDR family member 4 [Holothuria leucospilota]|uniref:Dehydrogenase/reductase SDR family member 4 n=1 Tax=Holothuria leucospilota TaxID=206669 RepID=A0A9Q1HAE4_HOLLE|nr:Dehydrogenase/reductase SDR family member 4 [Holothuria leucospilota]